MTEQSCDNCAKRSEWITHTPSNPRHAPYLMAECLHRPLQPFWYGTPLMVEPHCGTECGQWKEAKGKT